MTAAFSFGLLVGCETVVDVSPPPFESQLVAHSFFSAESLWVVRVTNNVPFTSPDKPAKIEDAVVRIYEDGQLVVEPARTDSGTYAIVGPKASDERLYTLRVEAPGYNPIEGSDRLPERAHVTDFRVTIVREPDEVSRLRRTLIEITVDDPADTTNFYGLLLVQARWSEDLTTGTIKPFPPTIFPFESDNLAFGESQFDFIETEKTLYYEAFFTDRLFDGTSYTLDFDLVYEDPHPDATVVVHRAFAVVLLSLSENFFRYWKDAGDQAFSNENPFAEPLRVHSNLSGGLGVFGGFRYDVLPLSTGPAGTGGLNLADLCVLSGLTLPVCPTRLP